MYSCPIRSSSLFTVDGKEKEIVSELSTVMPGVDGFAIRSERTGSVVRFVYAGEYVDREGDTVYAVYIPAYENVAMMRELAEWRVKLYND